MREHSRYQRQMLLTEIGREGQKLLDESCVAVIGLGALGSVSANLLARAGIGTLILIDRDFLEISNLQRQILYDEQDVRDNLPKAIAAQRKLREINSEINIEAEVADVSPSTIARLLKDADLVVDGTDNFETRFLLNDFALKKKVPWIYGGAVRTEGMSFAVLPGETPCFRCLFGGAPQAGSIQTCDQVGILAPVAHLIASFQATEAIKVLAGKKDEVERKLWKVDLWSRQFKAISVEHLRDTPCPGCKRGEFPYLEQRAGTRALALCGRNAVQIYQGRRESRVDFRKLAGKLDGQAAVEFNEFLLSIRIEPFEITVFRDGRAIVKGTEDAKRAKSLYAQYVGI
jgi:adenylyltransferase/sulfurtransferase